MAGTRQAPTKVQVSPRRRRRATPGAWTRKNLLIDQRKLDRAKTLLGVPTETAAVDLALDFVAFRGEVFAGIDRLLAVGGLRDPFKDR